MASQKLQVGRALSIFKTNNTDIPFPGVTVSDSATSIVANQLVCSNVDFEALGVKVGDIVWNTTGSTSANVVRVIDANTLELDNDIFAGLDNFSLFQGGGNNGCVLYIGGAGNVNVETIGGDDVTFVGMVAGQFVPVQVLKLKSGTTATDILALW